MPDEDLLALLIAQDVEGIQRAFAAGADPRAVDEDGVALALHAADSGRIDLVEPFLDRGYDLEAADGLGFTLLHAAVLARSRPLVEWLLLRGARPDLRTVGEGDNARTALHSAVAEGQTDLARALLRHGADVNAPRGDGWTALMLACHGGDLDLVQLLLDAGADVGATTAHGAVTAAAVAEARRHVDVLALLASPR